jgi:hypothetical protein
MHQMKVLPLLLLCIAGCAILLQPAHQLLLLLLHIMLLYFGGGGALRMVSALV